MIKVINLIILKIKVYSKRSECCTNGNNIWVVNQIDGYRVFVNDLPIWYAINYFNKR